MKTVNEAGDLVQGGQHSQILPFPKCIIQIQDGCLTKLDFEDSLGVSSEIIEKLRSGQASPLTLFENKFINTFQETTKAAET